MFSRLVQNLYRTLGDGMNVGAFVAKLVDNFMEDPANEADDEKAAGGEYNPFSKLQEATLKQYYNGNSKISQKNATVILGRTDKAKFAAYIDESSPDALNALCGDLHEFGVEATVLSVGEACADLFEKALRQSAVNKKTPAQAGREEYSDELGIFPDGRVPMESVYLKDGRLHIGGTSIKLSDKLTPPTETANEEQGYLPKLFEAYTDAETPGRVSPDNIKSYPKYNRNLMEQRINFYNALYVMETVRSKFGKEWGEQLEFLKQEAYDGISDVYFSDSHAHGYARLTAVLTQAVNMQIKKSLLASIRNLVGNSEKKGVCHILVSEGKIRSWVDIYDE